MKTLECRRLFSDYKLVKVISRDFVIEFFFWKFSLFRDIENSGSILFKNEFFYNLVFCEFGCGM